MHICEHCPSCERLHVHFLKKWRQEDKAFLARRGGSQVPLCNSIIIDAGAQVMPSTHFRHIPLYNRVVMERLTEAGFAPMGTQCSTKYKKMKGSFFEAIED